MNPISATPSSLIPQSEREKRANTATFPSSLLSTISDIGSEVALRSSQRIEKNDSPLRIDPEEFVQMLKEHKLPNQSIYVTGGLCFANDTVLTVLPEGLHLGGDLDLSGCTSLTTLPEGLKVEGNLKLIGCTSFKAFPERLQVGGNLNFSGCTSLTTLPKYITQLGLRSNGELREVDVTNTGVPDELIDLLRGESPPGIQFQFSRKKEVIESEFSSIDEAVQFWKQYVTKFDSSLSRLVLDDFELSNLLEFLYRLKFTADFKNLSTRNALADRLYRVLCEMEINENFKVTASYIISEGITTCIDKISSALDNLDLMLLNMRAEEIEDREELLKLGRGMYLLEEVRKEAEKQIETMVWVDEVEVHLAFQIGLREKLQLPLSTRSMHLRELADVTDEEIQKSGDAILQRVNEEAINSYLISWTPWQKMLRREALRT